MTEVYLLFYQSALQIFISLNLFLQKQDPLIGSVSYSLKRFLRLLACKFIPPQTVKATSNFKELFDVEKHKNDSSVDIGLVTRTTLNNLIEFGDASTYEQKMFYEGAKAFFLTAFKYGVDRMPVDDPVLQNPKR
ncbi:ATP-dependent DNA helicase [Paramuricea clavata]|uniref:ATP-dependent DNA helicase n=1 Tax=Paramuricea clavata TaxID=317549 RepID=A0A7D9HIM3_PARCT|nr:ATP-dependent DNA helicase [Paramuricea clavata]